jgi:uncharacterized protein YneF (UPF0154 family)
MLVVVIFVLLLALVVIGFYISISKILELDIKEPHI